MSNPRLLKVDLTITLVAGGHLDIGGGGWVKLASQPSNDSCWYCWLISSTIRSELTEERLVLKEHQAPLFMASNWDNLTQEFAQGHGEYLASLASLLEIPPADYSSFFKLAQDRYAELSRTGQVDPQEMLQLLVQSKVGPVSIASLPQIQ